MKFLIPEIGTQFLLTEDWTFSLYGDYRNEATAQHLGLKQFVRVPSNAVLPSWPVTIPAGTKLSVDRVYIRRGKSDFSSLTFNFVGIKGKGRLRFWAKLADVNNMSVTLI